jgi:cation diffusion facilitator family transporter
LSIQLDADRAKNSLIKQRAALASVLASLILALAKLAAGLLSGSLALISEGAHNGLDIGASAMTFFAVREADKPADAEHPFGHAKIEAVAALAETGFLAALAIVVAIEALRRIGGGEGIVDANLAALGVIVASIGVDFFRWRALTRIARETGSDALKADALHYSSDLVSSLLVLAGLGATRLGFGHADALAAIGVALFIAIASYRLGRHTIDALVDAAPKGLAEQVGALIAQAPAVAALDIVRLRPSGAQIIGEVGFSVSRTLPLERVMAIKADVAGQISARWPQMSLTLTATARQLDDESVMERVYLIAARRRLAVHHVTIQEIDGRKCVSFDLEVSGRMPIGEAHEVATRLEASIEDEIGPDVEVETHIEPIETREIHGAEADPTLIAQMAAALTASAAKDGRLCEVHEVRVRLTSEGAFVIFHCRVDANATVDATHDAVDALERSLRVQFPRISRVVGHAEPAPGTPSR